MGEGTFFQTTKTDGSINCRNPWVCKLCQIGELWKITIGRSDLTCFRCMTSHKMFEDFEVIYIWELPPETNSEFTPENGWLEYERFLLGWSIFRGYVSFREGKTIGQSPMDAQEFLGKLYQLITTSAVILNVVSWKLPRGLELFANWSKTVIWLVKYSIFGLVNHMNAMVSA